MKTYRVTVTGGRKHEITREEAGKLEYIHLGASVASGDSQRGRQAKPNCTLDLRPTLYSDAKMRYSSPHDVGGLRGLGRVAA